MILRVPNLILDQQYDEAGTETDSQMNFTVGGNFAGGKGNVVSNAQFESIGQVFYDQANDRLYNCESGFSSEILLIQGNKCMLLQVLFTRQSFQSWHFGKANAQGQRAFGDNGGNSCPTLVSTQLKVCLQYTDITKLRPNCFGIPNYWCGALPDGNSLYV